MFVLILFVVLETFLFQNFENVKSIESIIKFNGVLQKLLKGSVEDIDPLVQKDALEKVLEENIEWIEIALALDNYEVVKIFIDEGLQVQPHHLLYAENLKTLVFMDIKNRWKDEGEGGYPPGSEDDAIDQEFYERSMKDICFLPRYMQRSSEYIDIFRLLPLEERDIGDVDGIEFSKHVVEYHKKTMSTAYLIQKFNKILRNGEKSESKNRKDITNLLFQTYADQNTDLTVLDLSVYRRIFPYLSRESHEIMKERSPESDYFDFSLLLLSFLHNDEVSTLKLLKFGDLQKGIAEKKITKQYKEIVKDSIFERETIKCHIEWAFSFGILNFIGCYVNPFSEMIENRPTLCETQKRVLDVLEEMEKIDFQNNGLFIPKHDPECTNEGKGDFYFERLNDRKVIKVKKFMKRIIDEKGYYEIDSKKDEDEYAFYDL